MNFYVEVIQRQADDLAMTICRLQDTLLKDRTQPLEERWEAYLLVEPFLPNDSYSDGHIEELGWDSPYDDFGIEKYQTIKYSTILENIQENLGCMLDADDREDPYYTKYANLTSEQLDNWKEAVLHSGHGSFTWDW